MRKLTKLFSFMVAIVLAYASTGCRTVTVDLPDGRKVNYVNVGFDTKIGRLVVVTPEGGRLELENLDGSSQALSVAGKALDLANHAASPLP